MAHSKEKNRKWSLWKHINLLRDKTFLNNLKVFHKEPLRKQRIKEDLKKTYRKESSNKDALTKKNSSCQVEKYNNSNKKFQ